MIPRYNQFFSADNTEDILHDLLTEVMRSLSLNFPAGGIEEFTRGALRLTSALYRRDFLTSITETVKLSVQIYKALPSSSTSRSHRGFQ